METPEPAVHPPAGLGRRVLAYLLAALAPVAFLAWQLRLPDADLRAPFMYGGDALLILPLVKATAETGTHWRNERLGAPGAQELHDFPVVDHLHFAVIWAMTRIDPDPVLAFNLYYLLTYPLAALAAMFALRRLGLSLSAAGCAAVLYAFLPGHYLNGVGHYFLSAYYHVPLVLMVTLWVCQGRLPFFRPTGDGGHRLGIGTRDTLEAVVIGVVTASAGAYYAYFACALLAAGGLYGAVAHTWRAAASAGLVVLVVAVGGLANHAPTFAYQYENGKNSRPHTRRAEEADLYGFKLAHLVLPCDFHRVPALHRLKVAYNTPARPLENENRASSLGAVGSVGLVTLVVVLFLPVRRRWPLGPLASLTAFALLLGWMGGLGSLVAFLVSPQVRAYNRVGVFLAFLALFAFWWVADRALAGRRRWVRLPAFLGVAVLGLYDQTSTELFGDRGAAYLTLAAQQYRADEPYFADIERAVPGGAVFTLPYRPYPEPVEVTLREPSEYEQIRGYLHTRTVRWSYGAMKGREEDQWQREVAGSPPEAMARRVALRGFDGLHIDRRGYATGEADTLLAALDRVLGPAPRVTHPDGSQVFLDLRPYRDRLRAELGDGFAAEARRDAEAVRVLWLDGFAVDGDLYRCGPHGQAVIVNPTDRPRRVRVTVRFRSDSAEPTTLVVAGVWAAWHTVHKDSPWVQPVLVVPPGRHTVRFRCAPPTSFTPQDSRRLFLSVEVFKVEDWAE